MQDVTVIALCGRAGAGKDSLADVLCTHGKFVRLAFADPLRAEVAEAFSLGSRYDILTNRDTKDSPHDALTLRACKSFCFIGAVALATGAHVNSEWLDTPRSPRQIMQWWGGEYRRKEKPGYWVSAMASRMTARAQGGAKLFVVTDCRHENEAALIRGLSGQLWRVERAGLPDVEGTHESATGRHGLKPDAVIQNDGTLLDLRATALRHWWALMSNLDPEEISVEVGAYAPREKVPA